MDKEAIGLSRVQGFFIRPPVICVNLIFKHIHAASSYTVCRKFVPFIYCPLILLSFLSVSYILRHCVIYNNKALVSSPEQHYLARDSSLVASLPSCVITAHRRGQKVVDEVYDEVDYRPASRWSSRTGPQTFRENDLPRKRGHHR